MSGFKVFSTDEDLDYLFLSRGATDPSTALVNYITPSGQNLSERYLPYSSGTKAPTTGFKLYDPLNLSNKIDLSDLFAYNYYGFTTTYASNPESVNIRTSIIFGTEYVAVTFNSLSNQYYYKPGSVTANARYNAGSFIVTDVSKIADAKVILVSGGGGGGVGLGSTTTYPASGGGGGTVHFLDVSFVNNASFIVEVGNGGAGAFRDGTNIRTPPSRGGSSKITLTNGTAIINNVAYTTNDFFDASNNGFMGQNTYSTTTSSVFKFDNALNSDIDANVGAGAGGGGGAWANYSTALRSGGPGNLGSNGGSVLSLNRDCAAGGGGGGIGASPIDRTVNTDATGRCFGDGGNGGNGTLITTTGFGSTYYGGGGGAAQATMGPVPGATSGFLLQGKGGLGGGGTAYRSVTAVSGGATGGGGIHGLGGGGGGISATQVNGNAGVNPRQAGVGGHGTVIFTFKIVGGAITKIAGDWSALGTGVNSEVKGISSIDPSNVYMAGYFTQVNGSNMSYVAKWDGSSWSTLGSGTGLNYLAHTVSILDASNIYFGGEFAQASLAGGNVFWANNIIRWTGSDWDELGPGGNDYGVSSYVYAIHALNSTNTYLTGRFTGAGNANSIPVSRVARWTGTTWAALGSGLNGFGRAIWAVDTSNVYVGGEFTAAGGVANTAYLGKWDGSAWSALGTGVNNYVYAISALDASNVYVGGDFTTANGITVNRIAKWDGSSWSTLGSGTNGSVFAIHAYDADNIIVGGSFTTAGGITCNRVAKWNGTSWSAFGSGTVGVNSYVNAVRMVSPITIYVGGNFTTAGGVSCNRIAKFTGT